MCEAALRAALCVKQLVTATLDSDIEVGDDEQLAKGEEILSRLMRITGDLGRAPLLSKRSGEFSVNGDPGSALFGLDIDLRTAGVIIEDARLEQVFVPAEDEPDMVVVAE